MTKSRPTIAARAGALVKGQRVAAGMTQAELAALAGWPNASFVSRIERGRAATLKNLDAIAVALGCKLKELVP